MSIQRTLAREVAALRLAATGTPGAAVTEADLAPLPAMARRYLRFMGAVGRPRDTSFRLHVKGRFRRSAKEGWLAADAWQYSSQPDVARVFHMTLRMFGVPVYGRDTYVRGKGRMLVRPLDLFTVEDARGPEYDLGELVTWLNDAVLLAPSMLLAPNVRFAEVDDGAFDVSVADHGLTARARVLVAPDGAPRDFETTDRFCSENPFDRSQKRVRARWTTPVDGFVRADGRAVPTGGRAVWHLPQGDFTYAELVFDPAALVFNVPPGA